MRIFEVSRGLFTHALLAVFLAVPPALATEVSPGEAAMEDDLQVMSLEELLNSQLDELVSSTTKSTQRGGQAPAVVTVIRAKDIQARGYRTLADILRSVPGMYDVYDGVYHNLGVRGLNSGIGSSGSVVKLLIDGEGVDYRPTNGNFLGEELIPIEVIDRVEVIRGPASALYGANAFLGVINVVTRSASSMEGVTLSANADAIRSHPGGGVGAVLATSSASGSALIAASLEGLDRSGLGVPGSSPARTRALSNGISQDDLSSPKSAFLKLAVNEVLGGTVSLLGTIQNLDSKGAFQSIGPLSPQTRIALLNQHYRLSYTLKLAEAWEFTLSASHFSSYPRPQSLYDVGQTDGVFLPSGGAEGYGGTEELHWRASPRLELVQGLDYSRDTQQLLTYDERFLADAFSSSGGLTRRAGTIVPGEGHGAHRLLTNLGFYGQAIVSLTSSWTVTGGARLDEQNIYGLYPSGRVGLVYAPPHVPYSLKLLYGSSFKAPSAVQLFAKPVAQNDQEGSPFLKPQIANTEELAFGYRLPAGLGEFSANVFVNEINGLVEYHPGTYFLEAQNSANETVVGGELDTRLSLTEPLRLRLSVGYSRLLARQTPLSGIAGTILVNTPLFPELQAHLVVDYRLPWAGLQLSTEVSYIGPREASQSNAVINGSPYSQPAYVFTSAALASPDLMLVPKRETRVVLRVSDALNVRWAEPGAAGFDVPTQGREIRITLTQQL